MAKVFGPSGLKGIDVETPSGTKSYSPDAKGFLNVDNPRHLKQMLHEGMAVAADASFGTVDGFECSGCAFTSVFKAFDCPKCGVKNDYRD